MYAIQKNIPIPKIDYNPSRKPTKYPLSDMAVGDMLFLPGKTPDGIVGRLTASGRELGCTFMTRRTYMRETAPGTWVQSDKNDPEAERGLGIWRTA